MPCRNEMLFCISPALAKLFFINNKSVQFCYFHFQNELLLFKEVVYYMNYALSAYGWPIYMKNNVACGCCKLLKSFR